MKPIEFVSLGPGSADDVTLGTYRLLQSADKIYCFASGGRSHAADIILLLEDIDYSRIIQIDVPMLRNRDAAHTVYTDLAHQLMADFQQGCRSVVATEGDTGIFATTHYVMDLLVEAGIPVVQHAGVPSFIAAGSVAGLHLVKLQERLMIIPGEITANEIEQFTENGTNLVIMKLSMARDAVLQCMNLHPEYHYHYFAAIGTPRQEYTCTLSEIKQKDFPYFSLMFIQK